MSGSAQTTLQARVCACRSKYTCLGTCRLIYLYIYGLVKLCGYCTFKHNLFFGFPHIMLTWFDRVWCKLFVKDLFPCWDGSVRRRDVGHTVTSTAVCTWSQQNGTPLVVLARGADTCRNCLHRPQGSRSQWHPCLGLHLLHLSC